MVGAVPERKGRTGWVSKPVPEDWVHLEARLANQGAVNVSRQGLSGLDRGDLGLPSSVRHYVGSAGCERESCIMY